MTLQTVVVVFVDDEFVRPAEAARQPLAVGVRVVWADGRSGAEGGGERGHDVRPSAVSLKTSRRPPAVASGGDR